MSFCVLIDHFTFVFIDKYKRETERMADLGHFSENYFPKNLCNQDKQIIV